MSQQNVNTAAQSTQESSINYDAIRRALRRYVFVKGLPDVNTAGIRSRFDMGLEYLAAARFTHKAVSLDKSGYTSSIEMLLIKPQERLSVAVTVFSRTEGGEYETYEVQVVHCANPLYPATSPEKTEYETSNFYQATGDMTDEARALFDGERQGLKRYAAENLREADENSPFSHWHFVA